MNMECKNMRSLRKSSDNLSQLSLLSQSDVPLEAGLLRSDNQTEAGHPRSDNSSLRHKDDAVDRSNHLAALLMVVLCNYW